MVWPSTFAIASASAMQDKPSVNTTTPAIAGGNAANTRSAFRLQLAQPALGGIEFQAGAHVDDHWPVMPHRFLDHRHGVLRLQNPHALGTEGGGIGGEVRVAQGRHR